MLGVDNLQSHPLLLILVLREPNGGEATGTKLMHNSVAPAIVFVAQVNRMEAPGHVSLDVFRVANTLGEEEACVVVLLRGQRGRHFEKMLESSRMWGSSGRCG